MIELADQDGERGGYLYPTCWPGSEEPLRCSLCNFPTTCQLGNSSSSHLPKLALGQPLAATCRHELTAQLACDWFVGSPAGACAKTSRKTMGRSVENPAGRIGCSQRQRLSVQNSSDSGLDAPACCRQRSMRY